MRNLSFFVLALLLSWTSIAQSPVLQFPIPNSSVGYNSLTQVVALAGNSQAHKLIFKILVNDPRQMVYATSHTFMSAQEASQPVTFSLPTPNGLDPNKQYLLELTAEGAGQVFLGQQYFTIFTTDDAPKPLLITTLPRYLCRHRYDQKVAGTISVTVNANNSEARKLKLKFLDDKDKLISGGPWPMQGESELVKTLTASEALSNQTFTPDIFLASTLSDTVRSRKLVLTSEDAQGRVLAVNTIAVSDMIRLQENRIFAAFVSPTNGATQVAVQPTITMKTTLDTLGAGTSCKQSIQYVYYRLDRSPADWAGNDFQQTYQTSDTWKPQALQPNTTYEIEVSYVIPNTPSGGGIIKATFTTASALVAPILISPTISSYWYACPSRYNGVGYAGAVVVNANHTSARKLKLKVANSAGQLISGGPYPQYGSRELEVTMSAAQALANQTFNPELFFPINLPDDITLPNCSIIVTSEDSLGKVLGVGTYPIPKLVRLRNSRVLAPPTFISPVSGSTNVSTRPVIAMNTPIDSVDASVPCRISMIYGSYELDRYPADWAGNDYIKTSGAVTATWQPTQELQPNTTYQVRVLYINIPNANAPTYVTTTFTTGASLASRSGISALQDVVANTSQAYPMPFDHQLLVQVRSDYQQAKVQLINQEGRKISTRLAKGGAQVYFDTHTLRTGLYLVRISDATGKVEQIKVVKQ